MDAKSGKMDWYFQLTPHDLYDWDLEGPPMLITIGGRELVVAAGKSGFVIALDAKSGKLVWKRSVGKHNGHDEDGALAMRGETSKLKPPFEIYPGTLGGVIAPMSTDGSRVFVPVVNHPVSVDSSGEKIEETSPENSGELVALNLKDGSVAWKHEFAIGARVRRDHGEQRRRLRHHLRRQGLGIRHGQRQAALAGTAAGRQQRRRHDLRRNGRRPRRPRLRRRADAADRRLQARRLNRADTRRGRGLFAMRFQPLPRSGSQPSSGWVSPCSAQIRGTASMSNSIP